MRLPPFQRLLDLHRDEVHRFLIAVAGAQEADDCFQETILAALRAYPRLGRDDNLRAWLLTIAHRKAIDAHRARARRAVPVPSSQLDTATTDPEWSGGGDPQLWRQVQALAPKQRAAIVLRFVVDLPHAEAAEVMGCSEEAARRSLHEALSSLRKDWT